MMSEWIIQNGSELYHHGILGMKWGIRRFQPYPDGYTGNGKYTGDKKHVKKQQRMAKKDAKEYARAKMFYGEGAGNRRKLIKATVNERSKDDIYKAWFDEFSKNQDMADHAKKATRERHAKDTVKTAKKTTKGVINMALGNVAAVSASAAALYMIGKYTGVDKVISKFAKDNFSKAKDYVREKKTQKDLNKFLDNFKGFDNVKPDQQGAVDSDTFIKLVQGSNMYLAKTGHYSKNNSSMAEKASKSAKKIRESRQTSFRLIK